MNHLEWLLKGDEVLNWLTRKYLLNEILGYNNKGYIADYLKLYNHKTKLWGNGFYGPKWISTNYTLLELKYMEIDPSHPIYQESLRHYLDYYLDHYLGDSSIKKMDLCISGMFIELLSYGKIQDHRLFILIDYVLDHTMPDGAWNCLWNHKSKPRISSVHTTINALEGLDECLKNDYSYRKNEVSVRIEKAIEVLMSRHLLFVKGTKEPIHPSFVDHHYPPRWKYDHLRILEYLARRKHLYQIERQAALDLLYSKLKNGRLSKGSRISGKIHFPIEDETYGRFNTLRAYIVLKEYHKELYDQIIRSEI